MRSDPIGPFGDERTWDNLFYIVRKILFKKFHGRVNDEVMDEAMGTVRLRLLEYWVTLPSSHNADGTLNYGYGITYGVHWGIRTLISTFRRNEKEMKVKGSTHGSSVSDTDDGLWSDATQDTNMSAFEGLH